MHCFLIAAALTLSSPCDAVVSRVEAEGSALSRSLTDTVCRFAAEQQWISAADVDGIRTRGDLRALLQKRSGGDLIDAGEKMFASFERATGSTPAGQAWETRDTEHYRLFARPGSAASRDIELIGAEAERSRAGLVTAFGLDGTIKAREAVTNRVAVYLYPARRDDTEKRVGRHSMGATSFGATIDDSGRGRLKPSIHILYFNPFSLAVLEHEIAHAVIMMAAFDPAAIDKPLAGETDLKKAFFSGYRPISAFVNEGFGDYGLYYAGFYAAWGLLGPPEELALSLQTQRKLPAISKLLRARRLDLRDHKAISLASATFLRYLLQTKGADAVRPWLLSASTADAFEKILGVTIDEAERGWSAWLRR